MINIENQYFHKNMEITLAKEIRLDNRCKPIDSEIILVNKAYPKNKNLSVKSIRLDSNQNLIFKIIEKNEDFSVEISFDEVTSLKVSEFEEEVIKKLMNNPEKFLEIVEKSYVI